MFTKLKFRNRILIGYSVPIFLLIGLSAIAYKNTNKISAALKQSQISQSAVASIDNAHIGVSRADRAMRGYLLTKDEKSRQSYETGMKNFQDSVKAADQVIQDPSQKARLQKIIQLSNRLNEFNRKLITLAQAGKTAGAIQIFGTRQGIQYLRDLEALADEFQAKELASLEGLTKEAQTANNILVLAFGLGTLVAIAIAFSSAYLISFSITRRLNQAANAIASSSTEIATTVEQQERTVSMQATSINQTTTTMEELDISSLQSAQQAEASASGAKLALTLAENGNRAVQQTMSGMSNLKEKVGAIAEQIIHLSEQTSQIGSISGLVGDLANQTNMLALNAAVEAARAGEHGKGFSVVAGEIRKLADQSKKSAGEITALVADIQAAINTTVMVTDEGTKTVDQSIQLAQGTAESFTGVADAVNNVFLNSQQISLNVKQQAIAVRQVVQAMNAVNLGAKESATGITQVKNSTQHLQEAAQDLTAMV